MLLAAGCNTSQTKVSDTANLTNANMATEPAPNSNTNNPDATATPNPTPTPTPAPKPAPLNSGVQGHVSIGPTCPVQTIDGTCGDKPYQVAMVIKTLDGKTVLANFSSDANGYYKVAVKPGTYIIATNSGGSRYPGNYSGQVTVKSNTYTTQDITVDSGIR